MDGRRSLKFTSKYSLEDYDNKKNLDVLESTYLNWIFKYHSLGDDCVERVYFSKVKKADIILNEESIGYKWCNLDEFIELIKWYGPKEILRKILENAFKNELYFEEEVIEEYN